MEYDFSGYATKNDLKCSDGRVIRKDAFKDDDGKRVPLMWQHCHDDPNNVLGHAMLENREDGVYAYCSLNETEAARNVKIALKHGDIESLSIFANRLVQKGQDVMHGAIREVSVVLTGANPGAHIDNLCFEHSDGTTSSLDDEAIIYSGSIVDDSFGSTDEVSHSDEENQNGTEEEEIEQTEEVEETEEESEDISHADNESNEETIGDVIATMNEKQQSVVSFLVGLAVEGKDSLKQSDCDEFILEHADDESDDNGETIQDVIDSMNEKQKEVLYYLVGQAMEDTEEVEEESDDELEQSDNEGDDFMKHNVFETTESNEEAALMHAEINGILDNARKSKAVSLREVFAEQEIEFDSLQHSITNLDVLFPEAQLVSQNPELISRPMGWVTTVMNSVKKSPFARIKSVAANITADEARARGYIKGKKKIEEVLTMLKRATTPQMIYKLQKFDREDVIDITDIDIVAWVKAEMRLMLDEEIARAILVGDGRETSDESHIKHENIRPIYTDDDIYTIKYEVDTTDGDATDKANAFIDAAVMSREGYMGSGAPVMFTTTKQLNSLLLAKDKIGHRLYANKSDLADALLVRDIIEVPVLENVKRDSDQYQLLALIVDLSDYTVGADKGGEVNMFDDFDIDYNKYEYLIETRISGALTKPYSAIALEEKIAG